ncbi:unnamed protein product, partial [Choristocarpus tenellus]
MAGDMVEDTAKSAEIGMQMQELKFNSEGCPSEDASPLMGTARPTPLSVEEHKTEVEGEKEETTYMDDIGDDDDDNDDYDDDDDDRHLSTDGEGFSSAEEEEEGSDFEIELDFHVMVMESTTSRSGGGSRVFSRATSGVGSIAFSRATSGVGSIAFSRATSGSVAEWIEDFGDSGVTPPVQLGIDPGGRKSRKLSSRPIKPLHIEIANKASAPPVSTPSRKSWLFSKAKGAGKSLMKLGRKASNARVADEGEKVVANQENHEASAGPDSRG